MKFEARKPIRNQITRLFTLLLLASAVGGCSLFGIRTAEQPEYAVVETFEAIELRDYAAHVTVETTVEADFEDAGNRAFERLFGYISGDNRARESIEMTAPVIARESGGETIEMTAPVVATRVTRGWTFAFVLPARYTLENVPLPLREDVRLGEIRPRRVAALSFSGAWRAAAFARKAEHLHGWIEANGFEIVSPPRFAAYDPPWAIPFLRRNEILIDIES